jgi:hypothetical protein
LCSLLCRVDSRWTHDRVRSGQQIGGEVSLFSVRTNISVKDLLGAASQPLTKLRPPPAPRYATDGDRDGLALADQDDQSFAPGDTRVQQIALQHRVVLRHDRDNDDRVFRALALMDRRGVSRHERVQFAKAIGH